MPEDIPPANEAIHAEPVEEGWMFQEELCAHVGINQEIFSLCLQWEIIHPQATPAQAPLRFSHDEVDRLCRGLRLHRDLGINWPGVRVALDLLDRLEELERQLEQS